MKGLAAAFLLAGDPAAAQPVEVPSGQPVEFVEVVRDVRSPAGLTWRFRFVAPEIARKGGSVSFENAAADMDALCQNFAIPRLPVIGSRPRQIVISLSDAALPFGAANPEITQFFEAYSVEGDRCVWVGY